MVLNHLTDNVTSLLSQCRGPLLIPMVNPVHFFYLESSIWNVHPLCLSSVCVCCNLRQQNPA